MPAVPPIHMLLFTHSEAPPESMWTLPSEPRRYSEPVDVLKIWLLAYTTPPAEMLPPGRLLPVFHGQVA